MARPTAPHAALGVALFALASIGCNQRLDVGSDVLWVALFEGNDLDEWTGVDGGGDRCLPEPPSAIEVSPDHPHRGLFAAKLTIDAGGDGVQQNTGLVRRGSLPEAAYYSAWYYLPRSAAVGDFWVIFKFRQRAIADDPASDSELFDLDLTHMPSGEMTLRAGRSPSSARCRWTFRRPSFPSASGSRSRPSIATPPTRADTSRSGWTGGSWSM